MPADRRRPRLDRQRPRARRSTRPALPRSPPSSPPSTDVSWRPARPARRRAGGPTCCRPAAISTRSTSAPCRPPPPGRSAGRRPTRWRSATSRTRASGRASIAMSAWGTSNMRTGGDDIAQVLALIGARAGLGAGTGRVTGFEIMPLAELGRPRIDVTLKISGMFRDAFPGQIDLIDSAVRAVAALDEDDDGQPDRRRGPRRRGTLSPPASTRARRTPAAARIFGAKPGAYGAGLQALIDEGVWETRGDLAEAFLAWGGFAYGGGARGRRRPRRLRRAARSGRRGPPQSGQPRARHPRFRRLLPVPGRPRGGRRDAARAPRRASITAIIRGPRSRSIRALGEEIARVVRGRAANPKWIAGVMRHGYKGAFEMAATVDYLFAFAATTDAVGDHHFDQLFDAYLGDEAVARFHRRGQSRRRSPRWRRASARRSTAASGRRARTAPMIGSRH